MKSPTEPLPADPSMTENDLLKLSELRSSAKQPVAPEVQGEIAELQSWDEPVDERGRHVGAPAEDDPTLGEDLVQQGVDDADTAARKLADEFPNSDSR